MRFEFSFFTIWSKIVFLRIFAKIRETIWDPNSRVPDWLVETIPRSTILYGIVLTIVSLTPYTIRYSTYRIVYGVRDTIVSTILYSIVLRGMFLPANLAGKYEFYICTIYGMYPVLTLPVFLSCCSFLLINSLQQQT